VKAFISSNTAPLIGLIALLLALAGCGPATPEATPGPRPTPTPIPTFSRAEPTAPPSVATAAAIQPTADEADTLAIERGLDRYVALECGSCHGDAGEGVDDAPSLQTYAASEEEFITFIRSGGALGAAHQYSTNRLSDSGGRNLYRYLVSLRIEGE
jgi:mono/diheme cytochrome c family protein